ncbi:hypothetical protein SK128_007921 [Halocaridina rubra]|uniref:Multiple inositol polyphosphate phosphatase 1 n=1 Tax=Halocaridina rubra TaxID=373956 RepID=A0AAN8ZYC2_HALRR
MIHKQNVAIFFVYYFILCCLGSPLCEDIGSETPISHLSTKTAYFNADKDDTNWERFNNEVKDCKAQQVWLLNRHGTRYPTGNDMDRLVRVLPSVAKQVVANYDQGRGCLPDKDVDNLRDWFPPYGPRDKENLQEMGFDELYSIGEYWRDLYPHLFNVEYDPYKFKVDFTVKNRTGQSAYHFMRGMFGDDAIGTIEFPEPHSPNFILRFYKSCPRWLKEVYRNNETTYKERRLFTSGKEFQSVVHAVSARLGFLHPLTPAQIESIYDECRYETAWWPLRKSAWCLPFSTYDFEVMEYHQDLKYYYEDSYGQPLNLETACQAVSNIYSHFSNSINLGRAKFSGIFNFAHDKTIFQVMTRLGLFRPSQHLRHDNFANMKNRVWKTSYLSPFAANLAFVLFGCGDDYRMGTFFQGQPIPLAEKCEGISCHWEEIKSWFEDNADTCNLSKLCMLHDEL